MTSQATPKTKVLGEQKAEADKEMLKAAFQETPDYRALIASSDRVIVVGRRGTGKSALAYKLGEHWSRANKTIVVGISPEEHQSIGLRHSMRKFGQSFNHVKAGARIAWKYALLAEIAAQLSQYYKFKGTETERSLRSHVASWGKLEDDVYEKLRRKLKPITSTYEEAEELIAELPQELDIGLLERTVGSALLETKFHAAFIIDKLDEGFEPDHTGIALIDGMLHAIIDLKNKIPSARPVIFLRDNIFRAIQQMDIDFSRNIEGEVLRLHWDEYQLFNLACARLKHAFSISQEKTRRIWEECTAYDLTGTDGFRKCLHQTLYRPRDILTLLNEAFYLAGKEQRQKIVGSDIDKAAKEISKNRLEDLHKEYSSIIPSLSILTKRFSNRNPELKVSEASDLLREILEKDDLDSSTVQNLRLFSDSFDALGSLYSIGFVGVKDENTRTFQFSHDGRSPNKELSSNQTILIHPCYWLALNIVRDYLSQEDSEEIYDEYDEYGIDVHSSEKEERSKRIGRIVSELETIPEGPSGASKFEAWCHEAIQIVFAARLTNVELESDSQSPKIRDIAATNQGGSRFWERAANEYDVKQVLFKIVNKKGADPEDYFGLLSKMKVEDGRLAFLITRDHEIALRAGKELDYMREAYRQNNVLIIKLSGKYLSDLVSKLRNPQKHDAPEKSLHGLLETYSVNYLGGNSSKKRKGRNKSR